MPDPKQVKVRAGGHVQGLRTPPAADPYGPNEGAALEAIVPEVLPEKRYTVSMSTPVHLDKDGDQIHGDYLRVQLPNGHIDIDFDSQGGISIHGTSVHRMGTLAVYPLVGNEVRIDFAQD